jgi:hypothetical protein
VTPVGATWIARKTTVPRARSPRVRWLLAHATAAAEWGRSC